MEYLHIKYRNYCRSFLPNDFRMHWLIIILHLCECHSTCSSFLEQTDLLCRNWTRYPVSEKDFRVAYSSLCTNGVGANTNDARFLPLLFVVLAISVRLAPEHLAGDLRTRRVTSLRYYWSCTFCFCSFFVSVRSDTPRSTTVTSHRGSNSA